VDKRALLEFGCVTIQQRKRRAGRVVGSQRMERFGQPTRATLGPGSAGNRGLGLTGRKDRPLGQCGRGRHWRWCRRHRHWLGRRWSDRLFR
jgi:hypothetical protein